MGQACCSTHDKNTEQLIVSTPKASDQPIFPDGALPPSPSSELSGDYVCFGGKTKVYDIVHINISKGGSGRYSGLGPLGSGDLSWDGTTLYLQGQSLAQSWQYQDSEFRCGNAIMRKASKHWSQVQESKLVRDIVETPRASTEEARPSLVLDGELFDSNPYLRTTPASPLYAALASGSLRLVRGCFLRNCWEKRQPWPMRQNIPESGFWPPSEACEMWHKYGPLFFFALSYSWLHSRLNDPDMWHLERVARIVEEFLACSLGRFLWFQAKGIVDSAVLGPPEDLGFFVDFCSLPQQDALLGILRSSEEHQQFVAGLGVADVIYGHIATTVIRISCVPPAEGRKYGLRGWTSFEESVSNAKPGYHLRVFTFDESFNPWTNSSHGIEMLSKYVKGQSPPLTPQQFQAELQRRHLALRQSSLNGDLFSNPEDKAFVLNKYSEVWGHVTDCELLAYRDVGWGKTEAAQLASILPEFARLKTLILTGSAIGCEGLLVLFTSVPPTIEQLTISHSAGGGAADGVARELPRLTCLRKLDLSACNFGDDGIEVLVTSMPYSLQHLELLACGFGERGAIAIAHRLSHLLKLFIQFNDLSGNGINAFVDALPNSSIEVLSADGTNLSVEEKNRFRVAWMSAQKSEHDLQL